MRIVITNFQKLTTIEKVTFNSSYSYLPKVNFLTSDNFNLNVERVFCIITTIFDIVTDPKINGNGLPAHSNINGATAPSDAIVVTIVSQRDNDCTQLPIAVVTAPNVHTHVKNKSLNP